ncbi:MAG: FAD-dependent oxidoreductase [Actinomycetota bacterium]
MRERRPASERNQSVWMRTEPGDAFPALAGDLRVDVAVVGGGIAGLTTAFLLKQSGASVAVLDGRRIASGSTGYTTAKVTSLHGLTYVELIATAGEEKARLYGEANQAAVGQIATLVEVLGADCDFESQAAFTYTRDAAKRTDVEAEVEAAVRLGLPASFVEDTELPFPVEGAIRFDGQAQFHPRRYCLALAGAIAGDGSHVFELSRAVGVDDDDEGATVRTDAGSVNAHHVVVTTLLPFVDRGAFFAKAQPARSYAMAIRVNGHVPEGMYLGIDSPTRSVRPVLIDGERGLVVGGGSHGVGQEDDTGHYYADLEGWARETFDVDDVDSRWSAQDYVTVDKLPYVGRSPRMSRTFVATGFRKWGMTNGTAAAMVLADTISGHGNPWSELFDATRIGGASAVKKLVEDNVGVAKRLLGGAARRFETSSAEHLAPGEGGVVKIEGDAVGAYRDPEGTLHGVSLTCTHLGCTVRWNPAETSWDCPCHGSRFSALGAMLQGPAVHDLDVIEFEEEAVP